MATRGTEPAGGAPRGTARHVPVLLPQMLQALAPKDGCSYIDATFGAGGYSEAILTAAPGARVLGIDRDPAALAAGRAIVDRNQGRLHLIEGRFGDLDRLAPAAGFALADIQTPTDHTVRLGAVQLPREEFERRLAAALS